MAGKDGAPAALAALQKIADDMTADEDLKAVAANSVKKLKSAP
jgi:hypothetical protein